MNDGIKPVRRVVTGVDAQGRSKVLIDSAAPGVKANTFKKGTGMTDIWLWNECPAPIGGDRDDGDVEFHFEPPDTGGRLRIVQSDCKPPVYDASSDKYITAEHAPNKTPGGTWERGKQNLYTTRIHKSETVDYGILLEGERLLVLDSGTLTMNPGDVVVQLGNWHGWTNPNEGSLMAFVMMGGKYEEQP